MWQLLALTYENRKLIYVFSYEPTSHASNLKMSYKLRKPKNIRTEWQVTDMVHGYNVIAIIKNHMPIFLRNFQVI